MKLTTNINALSKSSDNVRSENTVLMFLIISIAFVSFCGIQISPNVITAQVKFKVKMIACEEETPPTTLANNGNKMPITEIIEFALFSATIARPSNQPNLSFSSYQIT